MTRPVVVAAVVALLAASCWKPELAPTYGVTVISDVVYGQGEVDGGGTFDDLLLDLYIPQVSGQDRYPLVVVIHGGGFFSGDKAQANVVSWAQGFASRGYIVASIDYRLAGDDPVPSADFQPILAAVGGASAPAQTRAAIAAMDDTVSALEFLHARPDVEEWQTVLAGGSAGAITAVYVGYAIEDFGIQRPPVAAVISNWGGFANSPLGALFLEGTAANYVELGYIYVEPPVYLAHGTNDPTVDYSLAQDIVDRAEAIGHPYRLHAEVGAGHGFNLFTTEHSPGVSVFQDQVDWLDSFLVGVTETPLGAGAPA